MDYLVNLSLVKPAPELDARMEKAGVTIRRALAPEFELVTGWVREKFSPGWSSETAVSFARQPPTCFLATRAQKLIGFACHESIARGFFGPTGVDEGARGEGIGHALLLASLLDLKVMGYGYAIIGDVGPSAFYERTVGATPIPNSAPGVYAGLLNTAERQFSGGHDDDCDQDEVPAGNILGAGGPGREPGLYADLDQQYRSAACRFQALRFRPGAHRSRSNGRGWPVAEAAVEPFGVRAAGRVRAQAR